MQRSPAPIPKWKSLRDKFSSCHPGLVCMLHVKGSPEEVIGAWNLRRTRVINAKFVTAKFSPSPSMDCRGSMPVDGELKRLPRQRATVSNETGSELGQEFRGDSDSAFRQR